MKKIYGYIGSVLLTAAMALGMTACSPESFPSVSEGGVPVASEFVDAIQIKVDQETNKVTFILDSNGSYPIWIQNGTILSTSSGYSRVFAKAGEYSMEVKIGNQNGISDGSFIRTFTLENTLINEDAVKALTGGLENSSREWVWNSEVGGHFGCGEPETDGLNWWAAGPDEKAGSGMYDDIMTFSSDNTYTYDPGEDGLMYVNNGITIAEFAAKNPNNGEDFSYEVSKQTSTWELTYEGDDLYLVFPQGTLVSYLANDYTYNTPKFKVYSISNSKLVLLSDDGNITWRYEFIPKELFGQEPPFDEGRTISPSEYGTEIQGTWMWEASTFGHFGCGENDEDPLGWWAANAYEKEDWGMYDDILTFGEGGSYTFDPGEGGQIYVNKGVEMLKQYYLGDDQDYMAPVEKQTSTYQIVNEGDNYYLTFAANTYVSYLSSDAIYQTPKFRIMKMTTTMMEFASVEPGISWKYRLMRVD